MAYNRRGPWGNWGGEDEDEEAEAASIASVDKSQPGSKVAGNFLEPLPARRPLPSLFTNANAPAVSSSGYPGSTASKPPKLPNKHRPAFTIREKACLLKPRARSMDVDATRRRAVQEFLQSPRGEVTEAGKAHSEGSRQAKAALEQLRKAKKGASLEETLDKLNALQRQVRALGEQLPQEAPMQASRQSGSSTCASTWRGRSGSFFQTRRACSLPPLDPDRRRRAASAPAAGKLGQERLHHCQRQDLSSEKPCHDAVVVLGKVAPGLAQKIPEDVDEEVIVLWIAYFVHTLLTLYVWGPLASAASSGGVIANFFQNFIFDFTPYLHWLAIGPFIHLILMPLFIQRKKQYVGKQRVASLTKQQSNLDPEGKTVVFSIKFTLMQKIFIFFVGNWIKLIAFIIKLLSFIGIDLSCFWFPMPFFQFWLATLQVKNYRILGAKVRLNAIQADAYFKFLHEALCNFYTFGLYSKLWAKIKGKSYNKWLDKNVEWDGLPPPGCNNDFMIFNDKLSFIQKILLMFVDLFFGFAPFFQVIASYLGYKMRLKNLTFGGITPQFVPEFTFGLMLKHYLKSCCYFFGLCAAKEKKFVDMNIGPLVVDVEAAGAGITAPSGMAPTYLAPAPLPMMTHGATQ